MNACLQIIIGIRIFETEEKVSFSKEAVASKRDEQEDETRRGLFKKHMREKGREI